MALRAHTRYPLKTRISLSWDDERGISRISIGETVDISERGMALVTPDPIPLRSYVHYEMRALRMRGSGSVRFIRRDRLSHFVGIEFSGHDRWDPDKNPLPEK